MVEGRLGQVALPADAVHDLQLGAVLVADVADEAGEILSLLVETKHVHGPQGEGGVADPHVTVVPVALAARGLGQRRVSAAISAPVGA